MAVYSLTKLQSEKALRKSPTNAACHSPSCARPVCTDLTKPYTLIPLDLIRRGLPVILGDGRGLIDVVYVDDVARAMLQAAESPDAHGEVFNIGHETVTLNEFYAYYSRMLNRPARHLPAAVPRTIMTLAEWVPASFARRLEGLRKGAAFLLQASENTSRFPSSRAVTRLGYAPRVNLTTGMLATEVWARKQHFIGDTTYSLPGRPLRFRPAALAHPENEGDIAQILRIASEAGLTAKAIGPYIRSAPSRRRTAFASCSTDMTASCEPMARRSRLKRE
jgi:hypothetical protein